jgi:PST family polysaccharide transporter
MLDLRDKTINGLHWSIIAQFGKSSLRFVISVILARLLAPVDFGLVGMIFVITGFAGLFSELGFEAALIQRRQIEEHHLSTIFWLNIFTGLALSCTILAIAPLVAAFYNEPRLKILTMILAANFFMVSLRMVHNAILKRSMDFRKLALIEIIATIIAGGFAISLALLGFGVWSLVWQVLISTGVSVILVWQISEWKPRFSFSVSALKELISFSGNLFGFNIFNYWVRNTDDLLIGKFIGSASLGIYSRAYSILLMPISQISAAIGRVMFPALSRIQEDKIRVKQIYLRCLAMIALVTFPMMLGLLVVADSFVLVLFGPKWVDVIPILKVLCLLGMVESLVTTLGWIYTSQGRTDLFFRWSILAGALLILSIVIGIWIGTIMAVTVCYSFTSGIILLYPAFAIPGKLIEMRFGEVVQCISGILLCAVLMSLSVWLLGGILPQEWSHGLKLFTKVIFGSCFYFVLIHTFRLKAYVELKLLIIERLSDSFIRIKKI